MPQTQTQIRNMLTQAGLWAKRRLGQSFLIDGNLMNKLVEAAEIGDQDVVLEVGAGTGSLTEMLLERARRVVTVEIDRGLATLVFQLLGENDRLTLLNTDVLRRKTEIADVVLESLQQALAEGDAQRQQLLLVSNLPYNVASPLLIDLVACGLPFSRMCFTVQAEVAERILANHGSKDFGLLGIALQATSSMEKLFSLPPQVFWPEPQVDSTAMRLDVNLQNFQTPERFKQFLALLHLAFAHRRKTLHYNLKRYYDEELLQQVTSGLQIDLKWRAEQLPVMTWLELFAALPPVQQHSVLKS